MVELKSGNTKRKAGWVMWAVLVPMTLLAGLALRWSEGALPPGGTFALLIGIVLLAFAGSYRWWSTLDFMQKDAQLVAWYWGSSAGGVIVLLALVGWVGKGLLFNGAALMLGGQAAGFLLFWLVWRLQHRGRPA